MTRRGVFTVAALGLNVAASLALLVVLRDVALPAVAGLLAAYGVVR